MEEEIKNNNTDRTTSETAPKTYTEQEYDSLKAQYEALRRQYDEAVQTIKSFEGLNVEEIKAKSEEYKTKAEKLQADFDAFVYRSNVEKFVDTLNPTDKVYKDYITKQLIAEKLQFKDGDLLGAEKIVEKIKADYPNAFKQEGNTPTATFTVPQSTKKVDITFDDFKKMSIAERIKLKKENEDLYSSFTNKK